MAVHHSWTSRKTSQPSSVYWIMALHHASTTIVHCTCFLSHFNFLLLSWFQLPWICNFLNTSNISFNSFLLTYSETSPPAFRDLAVRTCTSESCFFPFSTSWSCLSSISYTYCCYNWSRIGKVGNTLPSRLPGDLRWIFSWLWSSGRRTIWNRWSLSSSTLCNKPGFEVSMSSIKVFSLERCVPKLTGWLKDTRS